MKKIGIEQMELKLADLILLCPVSSLERATARPLHELRERDFGANDRATVGARLETSVNNLFHACPFFVWGCPGLRSGVDLAIGHKDDAGNSPCRGSAPAIARVLSSPDPSPA